MKHLTQLGEFDVISVLPCWSSRDYNLYSILALNIAITFMLIGFNISKNLNEKFPCKKKKNFTTLSKKYKPCVEIHIAGKVTHYS